MSPKDLDRAVALRKSYPSKSGSTKYASSKNSKFDGSFHEAQAEASYMLLYSSNKSRWVSNNDFQRSGRWTGEEIDFVDFLVEAFDNGMLPIPQGVKLTDLLCEMLLCKPSRVTKKMKHARLSVRSYQLRSPLPGTPGLDCEMMSALQTKFLRSISQETTRLELRFNMQKSWKTHFWNLCHQIGSNLLDARDWIHSLEDMERRASKVEGAIRRAQRQRMGLALKTDALTAQNGVFLGGISIETQAREGAQEQQEEEKEEEQQQQQTGVGSPETLSSTSDTRLREDSSAVDASSKTSWNDASDDFIANMLHQTSQLQGEQRLRSASDDFSISMLLNESSSPQPPSELPRPNYIQNSCGTFLEEIAEYMETHDLAFQHVDVWVPFFTQGKEGDLRLIHAGHATRRDLEPAVSCQMREYGEYSTQFSFSPGVGLPGRVYLQERSYSWECHIDEADSKIFERAGGAKVYGVKTCFGFALPAPLIGRIVVALYSIWDVKEDPDVVSKCGRDLAKYCPHPKWKIAVEMSAADDFAVQQPAAAAAAASAPQGIAVGNILHSGLFGDIKNSNPSNGSAGATSMVHYQHPTPPLGSPSSASFALTSPCSPLTGLASSSPPSPLVLPVASASVGSTIAMALPIPSFQNEIPSLPSSSPSSSSMSCSSVTNQNAEEQRIATLLGEHMPLSELLAPGETLSASSMKTPSLLLPLFVSLRLLLLRSPARRSPGDNELIDVIKNSFRGYTQDNHRSDKDVAYLLVKEWEHLKGTNTLLSKISSAQDARQQDAHQCHVMNSPQNVSTYSTTGAPIMMPLSLSSLDSSKRARRTAASYFEDEKYQGKKRRLPSTEERSAIMRSSVSTINIGDENKTTCKRSQTL